MPWSNGSGTATPSSASPTSRTQSTRWTTASTSSPTTRCSPPTRNRPSGWTRATSSGVRPGGTSGEVRRVVVADELPAPLGVLPFGDGGVLGVAHQRVQADAGERLERAADHTSVARDDDRLGRMFLRQPLQRTGNALDHHVDAL